MKIDIERIKVDETTRIRQDIGDLDKWKLPAPGKGNKYIRVDNEILEVTEDLNTVVEAIGIVDDLLK